MSLRCPPGTSIAIAFARYGRVAEAVEKCSGQQTLHNSAVSTVNETCLLSQTLQVTKEVK